MSEKRRSPRRGYQARTNAVHVTVHTQDGSKLPQPARREAIAAMTRVAQEHGLLVNVAET
jgi:DNA-binding winged helix-turn-helix (wHTH) protein